MTDWLIIAAAVWFFVALTLYAVIRKWLAIKPATAEELGEFAQAETYPWGTAWVFDNDRDRQSPLVPIVFIHGLGGSIYSWRYQLEEFADRPLIAIDLLGFGKSAKPLDQPYDLDGHSQRIVDILNAKNIQACDLVGCSLGGALSLWLTSQHPERFRKAVVISPAAVATVVPFPIAAYDSLGVVGQRVISRPIIKLALQGGLVHHHKITDEIIETYLTPFRDPNAMACFFKTIATIKDIRTFNALASIKSPVLVLRGGGDRTINRRVVQRILKANPTFAMSEHPVGGHHLMEDEPEWVNGQIRAFLGL